MFVLSDLVDESAQKLRLMYRTLDPSVLSIVWGHTCIFIEEQMTKGKAVNIQGLGIFTFVHKSQELGNRGKKVTRTPVFVVADTFQATNDIKKEHIPNLTVNTPTVQLNNALIGFQSGTTRDIVVDFHKEAVRCLGNAARSGKGISIEFNNIGYLNYSGNDFMRVSFNSDFVALIQMSSPTRSSSATSSVAGDLASEAGGDASSYTKSLPAVKSFPSSPSSSSSRASTPPTSSGNGVSLPQMDLPERPKAPLVKVRSGSGANSPPISPSRYNGALSDSDSEEETIDLSIEGKKEPQLERKKTADKEKDRSRDTDLPSANGIDERSEGRKTGWGERDTTKSREKELQRLREKEQQANGKSDAAGDADSDDGDDAKANGDGCSEGDQCEYCMLAKVHEKATSLRLQQEKDLEDAFLREHRQNMKEAAEKHKRDAQQRKAIRDEADAYNRSLMTSKHLDAIDDKKKAYFGELLYNRKEGTPTEEKRVRYKEGLEEQISEKFQRYGQSKHDSKKDFEAFLESQREADERSRKQRKDEKERQKEYYEHLASQINERVRLHEVKTKRENSIDPSKLSTTLALNDRPTTASRDLKRRSFDANAWAYYKEVLQERKQKREEEKARLQKEKEDTAKEIAQTLQKQKLEHIEKKLQTRELLRSVWSTQLDDKRSKAFSELSKVPLRTSLDLGELDREKHKPKGQCSDCGRGILPPKNFRVASGDFRQHLR